MNANLLDLLSSKAKAIAAAVLSLVIVGVQAYQVTVGSGHLTLASVLIIVVAVLTPLVVHQVSNTPVA